MRCLLASELGPAVEGPSLAGGQSCLGPRCEHGPMQSQNVAPELIQQLVPVLDLQDNVTALHLSHNFRAQRSTGKVPAQANLPPCGSPLHLLPVTGCLGLRLLVRCPDLQEALLPNLPVGRQTLTELPSDPALGLSRLMCMLGVLQGTLGVLQLPLNLEDEAAGSLEVGGHSSRSRNECQSQQLSKVCSPGGRVAHVISSRQAGSQVSGDQW